MGIRVRAVRLGFYGKGKEGMLRHPGAEFDIESEDDFSDAKASGYKTGPDGKRVRLHPGWMERVSPPAPGAMPKDDAAPPPPPGGKQKKTI